MVDGPGPGKGNQPGGVPDQVKPRGKAPPSPTRLTFGISRPASSLAGRSSATATPGKISRLSSTQGGEMRLMGNPSPTFVGANPSPSEPNSARGYLHVSLSRSALALPHKLEWLLGGKTCLTGGLTSGLLSAKLYDPHQFASEVIWHGTPAARFLDVRFLDKS